MIWKTGKVLCVGPTRMSKGLVETQDREQLPITAHPVKKQTKGWASYQLLVVSPEVRKSRVKKERVWGIGMREGKKRQNCY